MKNLFRYFFKTKIITLQLLILLLQLGDLLLNLLIPHYIKKIIDNYANTRSLDLPPIQLIAVIVSIMTVLLFTHSVLNNYLTEKVGLDLRKQVIQKVFSLSYKEIKKKNPAKLLNILTEDIAIVKPLIANGIITLIVSVITIIGSTILMIRINVSLSLTLLGIVPFLVGFIFIIILKARKLFANSRIYLDKLNSIIATNIKAVMLIKVSVLESLERKKFQKVNEKNKIIGREIVKAFSLIMPLVSLFAGLTSILVIWSGGQQVINGEMTLGQITQFIAYTAMYASPVMTISMLLSSLGQANAAGKRIVDLLDSSDVPKAIPNLIATQKIETFRQITFKNVSFKPSNSTKADNLLKGLNFTIQQGEKVRILGGTGSGKSLLLHLLLGFLSPTKGQVLLNSRPILDYNLQSWLQLIGYAPQEPFLFNGTISDNITFGINNITYDDLEKVLSVSQSKEFIGQLPNGLNEIIGEHGSTLSGGEKQRIIIARALLRKPQLLILDNSTNNLDTITESTIFNNLDKQYHNITTIIVSQKIASISPGNKVIILDNGQIDSIGTCNELSQKSFIYQSIALSQKNINHEL